MSETPGTEAGPVTALDEIAEAARDFFATHDRKQPGAIWCDGKCKPAERLRALLSDHARADTPSREGGGGT